MGLTSTLLKSLRCLYRNLYFCNENSIWGIPRRIFEWCKVFHLVYLGNRIQIAHLKGENDPIFCAKICLLIGLSIIIQFSFFTIHLMPNVPVECNNHTHEIYTLYQLSLNINISILLTSRQYSYHGMCKLAFWLYSKHLKFESGWQLGPSLCGSRACVSTKWSWCVQNIRV